MQKLSFSNRTLFLIHPTESEVISKLDSPFAMLLLAETNVPGIKQQKIIDTAMSNGCVEFCCIGKYCEELHDILDITLEDRGLLDVVTTWHKNESLEDSIFYFVNLAGSGISTLVAVFGEELYLKNLLKEAIT